MNRAYIVIIEWEDGEQEVATTLFDEKEAIFYTEFLEKVHTSYDRIYYVIRDLEKAKPFTDGDYELAWQEYLTTGIITHYPHDYRGGEVVEDSSYTVSTDSIVWNTPTVATAEPLSWVPVSTSNERVIADE